ncbi:MAG: hypothetical protein K6B74_13060 [Ruminococcus sp.]|nr:hypothetical protein [Ruminococcus sp.]
MAENINIGNGLGGISDREQRALELCEAFSLAEDKFVDEMMSDEVAEKIRAANRRKTLRFRSSVAACAAVLAIVVGIGVIPKGQLKTAESAEGANNNFVAAEKSDAAPQSDNYDDYDGTTGDKAEEEIGFSDKPQGAAAPESPITTTTAMREEVAPEKKPKTIKGGLGNHGNEMTAEAEADEDNAASEDAESGKKVRLAPGEYLTRADGTDWFVGNNIDRKNCGKLLYNENGYDVYELNGFDNGYMTAVVRDNKCFAAITADFQKGSLAELAHGLKFAGELHCDQYMSDGEVKELDESVFRNSALRILTEYAVDYDLDPEFKNIDLIGDGNYICRLGNEGETFVEPIYISIHDKAVLIVCYNAAALFVAK